MTIEHTDIMVPSPAIIAIFSVCICLPGLVYTQNNPPVIPSNDYLIFTENSKANGSLIKEVTVTDSPGDPIALSTGDEHTRQCVWLNQTGSTQSVRGHVYMINPDCFDFDNVGSPFVLKFVASDGANHVPFDITVYLRDVNDNPPVFGRPAYVIDVPENATISTRYEANITATDADSSNNKVFTFHLKPTGQSPGLYEGVFTIDATSGYLTLEKALDYEKLSFYQYIITAVDKGNTAMTGSAEITIKVTDVQDTPPYFQGLPYLFTVTENTTWLGKDILAQDGDRGISRPVVYALMNNTGTKYCFDLFSLNSTGHFSLKDGAKLDRDSGILSEHQGVCRLTVMASEKITNGDSSANSTTTTTVTVTVEDIDDNVPTFNKDQYDANVLEEMTNIPLTIVGSTGIGVYDLDQGTNSEFTLQVQHTNGTVFHGIEATPSRVLSRATVLLRLVHGFKFDYETQEGVIIHVIAKERVNSTLTSTCTVTVAINNTNDNDPVFTDTEYSSTIPENTPNNTFVKSVMATDDDAGEFGKLTYTLKGSTKFRIEPNNGSVYTDEAPGDLDRETRDTYYLTVVATDSGGRRAVTSLTVQLSDTNDNHPQFLYDTIEMSISENTTTFTPNILIKATDRDQEDTNNSKVMYRLTSPDYLSNNFSINNMTGELIADQVLDYEGLRTSDRGQIQLNVTAYDLGSPSLEATAIVTITVHDENDNEPIFSKQNYTASIPENATPGDSAVKVAATDGDATSPNNNIRYYIEKGGSDLFRIGGADGQITVDLNARFDRETQNSYNLTVIAADMGTPPLTGTTTVGVTITDINDEKPTFDGPYSASYPENTTINTIIFTFSAKDADQDSHLVYSVSHMTARNSADQMVNIALIQDMFDIYPSNGSVYVSGNLDRETATQMYITVRVNDTNGVESLPQTATAMLTVNIQDVNDVPPEFPTEVYTASITESAASGTNVITVVATDVDTVGSSPYYTLVTSTQPSFQIDPNTGAITTKGALDRETHPQLNVTVVVSDGVNNSSSLVIVTVTDVNDNAPTFLHYDSPVNITEGNYTDKPLFLAVVNATDDDEGLNARVIYSLENSFLGNFLINETTGSVWAVQNIDRETKGYIGTFPLTVIAKNYETDPESLTNRTKLTVNVGDLNDNSPSFSEITYSQQVYETKTDNRTYILQVNATDPDAGVNGTLGVTYSTEGHSNGTGLFYVATQSGKVYANASMRNRIGIFYLSIIARDGGEPPKSSIVEVSIEVIDENNNPPVYHFPNGQAVFSILECAANGTVLTTINATDADRGNNGRIEFSFVNGSGSDPGPFRIDRNSGIITLNGRLSNKKNPHYYVVVTAVDGGIPPKQTQVRVTIEVKDVNDNPPQFESSTITAAVMEDTVGVDVTSVLATDDDSDSVIRYYIVPIGSYYPYFSVNETSGSVTVIRKLDRESSAVVNITVKAVDASQTNNVTCYGPDGTPVVVANTTTQILIITITDANDNPPVFLRKDYDTGIRKNVKILTSIFDLAGKDILTDKDSDVNSIHSFEILGDIVMPANIASAIKKVQPVVCDGDSVRRPLCVSGNGSVTTNMVFEEDMSGTMIVTVKAYDIAGNSTTRLKVDIIVNSQISRMLFLRTKGQVEALKNAITSELTNITKYTFIPDEVAAYTDNGVADITRSVLNFYVKDPKTGRILTAKEVNDLVDSFGTYILDFGHKYGLKNIKLAFPPTVEEVDEKFKQIVILAGATVLEALVICILVFVACRSKGKLRRKLKAATVTTKGEKDTADKKTSIVPGSNVYATMTNPILNKDVPLPEYTQVIDDTDSQNSLDLNDVGREVLVASRSRTEEKEAVMDMYGDDYYQPEKGVDPLQMVLSMHEMERKEQNGYVNQKDDDSVASDDHYDYINAGFQLETTEV